MTDSPRSLQDLFEELGIPPSDQAFVLRLVNSSDPFAGLSIADSSTSITRRLASVRLRQDKISIRMHLLG
jgi:hypothetical protein